LVAFLPTNLMYFVEIYTQTLLGVLTIHCPVANFLQCVKIARV